MDPYFRLRLCMAALFVGHKLLFKLVAVSLWTVALGCSVRLDVGERRALGLGNISLWTMDQLSRRLGMDALWLLPYGPKLVVTGVGTFVQQLRLYKLVSAALHIRLLQLQLSLLVQQQPSRRRTQRRQRRRNKSDSNTCTDANATEHRKHYSRNACANAAAYARPRRFGRCDQGRSIRQRFA